MIRRTLVTLLQTKRPALRAFCRPDFSRNQRALSNTPPIQEDEKLANALRETKLFKKVANNPEAVRTLREFGAVLQEAGITASEKPSALKLAKLAMDSNFRAQMTRIAEDLKKVDIDLSSKEVIDELIELRKAAGKSD